MRDIKLITRLIPFRTFITILYLSFIIICSGINFYLNFQHAGMNNEVSLDRYFLKDTMTILIYIISLHISLYLGDLMIELNKSNISTFIFSLPIKFSNFIQNIIIFNLVINIILICITYLYFLSIHETNHIYSILALVSMSLFIQTVCFTLTFNGEYKDARDYGIVLSIFAIIVLIIHYILINQGTEISIHLNKDSIGYFLLNNIYYIVLLISICVHILSYFMYKSKIAYSNKC